MGVFDWVRWRETEREVRLREEEVWGEGLAAEDDAMGGLRDFLREGWRSNQRKREICKRERRT
jgi:hypothetical protein